MIWHITLNEPGWKRYKAYSYPQAACTQAGRIGYYTDALKNIRMTVLPKSYSAEAMEAEMLTTLQEVIMDQVLKDWKHALSFTGNNTKEESEAH